MPKSVGYEFTIVGEFSEDKQVKEVAERIQEAISQIKTPYPLSLSIGYAKYSSELKTQQEFIALADKELYKAKEKFHKLNK